MTSDKYEGWSEEKLIERLDCVSRLLEVVRAEIKELELKESTLEAEIVRRKKTCHTDFADFDFYCWEQTDDLAS